ncbi:MAG: acyl-CoA thioesterase/BAAT N-terminal domain-containing protein [Deltaproteobacteria bacterium]|nr:acyl-CoA thioesterase/BAAT N-terminal domain-containing protein [Deltaproteobacteria bacterium]
MPEILVTPERGLVDEKLNIRLCGFRSGERITLKASESDLKLLSQATFVANDMGIVDLASQKPCSGSYDWIDPMGLILSMKPVDENREPLMKYPLNPQTVTYTALVDGKPVANKSIDRIWLADGVTRIVVEESGLHGVCFFPAGEGPHPAILHVSGSDGGLDEDRAALFAAHGFATLTLGYFFYQGCPENLRNISLEYFGNAIKWFDAHKEINCNRLAVTGSSRGGELSLILGSTFPQFKAVVALVPSAVVWPGITSDKQMDAVAWTYHGEPIPSLKWYVSESEEALTPSDLPTAEPPATAPLFLEWMKDEEQTKRSAIPVEKTNGAILLISAGDDHLWPSSSFSKMVITRLDEYQFSHPYKHLDYMGAGHAIWAPYLPLVTGSFTYPVVGYKMALGGKPKDQASANADAWENLIGFLGEHL